MSRNLVRNARDANEPLPQMGSYQQGYNNSWALVVGIDSYVHLNPLKYAVNDAEAVAELLKSEFGFKDEHVFLRCNADATKDEIERIVEKLIEETQADDRVIIFFAGHGETRPYPGSQHKDGYLAPVEARGGDWRTYIRTRQLTELLNNAAAKHILCVFDACFSGLDFTRSTVLRQHRAAWLTRRARFALTAGLDNQVVRDGGGDGHSIFTHYLLEGLRGGARGGHDDIVTAYQLMNYVREHVSSHTASIQTPDVGVLPGHGGGDLLFISQAARIPLEIQAALNDKRVKVRIWAVQQLAVPLIPGNAEMMRVQCETLGEVLRGDDLPEARLAAAQSLLRLADPLSLDILVEAFSLNDARMTPEVRRVIVLALGQLRQEGAIKPLITALREDADPQVQEAAVLALGELKGAEVSAALCEALKPEKAPAVRIAAAHALNALADPTTFDALEKALKDGEAEVRRWATRALCQMNNERAVYVLSRVVLGDPDPEVRRWATRALGQLGDARAVATLMIDLEYDPDATVRADAIKSLSNLGRVDFVDFITKALTDKEVEIRREGVRVLGKLNHPRAARPLAQALDDTEPSVRQAAVEALGGVESPDAVRALIKALKDEDDNVRRYAVQSLMRLKAVKAAGELSKLLKEDTDVRVRLLAATALGELGDAAFTDVLFDALADPALKAAAALSLGRLGDRRSLDYLREAIQSGDAKAKYTAIIVAGALGASELVVELRALLENVGESESLRAAAAQSLCKLNPHEPETKELLARVMQQDASNKVRADAAESLGQQRDAAYLEALTGVLTKKEEPEIVRYGAAVGLGHLGADAALQTLSDALRDPSDKVKSGAVVGLGLLQNPAAVGPLASILINKANSDILRDEAAQQLLELEDDAVLEAVLNALDSEMNATVLQTLIAGIGQLDGARKSRRAIDRLIKILQESADAPVRRAAASALGDIGDESAVAPLLIALEDESSSVAAWAVAALGKLEAQPAVSELRSIYKNKTGLQVWAAWASGRLRDDDALHLFEV